jgi:ABC-type spermidine/putrescine transport system permease subunit I
MQKGVITQILTALFGQDSTSLNGSPYYFTNAAVATISFFSFLGGIYFITFSKEKIEDEMVQRTRLDSFQFAAIIQILFIIMGFVSMAITKEPDKEGMMLFFVGVVLMFWICFIARFNYILHIKIR